MKDKFRLMYNLNLNRMKTKVLSVLISLFFASIVSVNAQQVVTQKIKVSGNCEMCQGKIEKAAKSVSGVSAASWNKKDKVLTVSFDSAKTNSDAVQKAVANVGYDTEKYKATNEAYNKLPSCCHYRD